MPTARLEAFSDGVLAIAITLLVLDVRPPHSRAGELARDLAGQWPSYAAYLVSFAIIGIIWVNHHTMFERIARIDRALLFLNLALLLTVALLPFPTALLADYIRRGSNAHVAAAVYSANMTALGLCFLAMWERLVRKPELLADGFPVALARRARRRTIFGPIVYGASIAVAFISPVACLVVYAAMALYFGVSYVPHPQAAHGDRPPAPSPPRSVSSA
jgi:uncharacterized membrane protein